MHPHYCGGSKSTTVDEKKVKQIETLGLKHHGSYQFTIKINGNERDIDLSATDLSNTKHIFAQSLMQIASQSEDNTRYKIRKEIRDILGL